MSEDTIEPRDGISRRKLLVGGSVLGAAGAVSYIAGRNVSIVPADNSVDVVIVGGGVMGAMLGVVIKLLQPEWRLAVFERLNAPGRESSAAWHNAGTGYSALCEPNYTPVENGRMETAQTVRISQQLQVTRQLLASLATGRDARPAPVHQHGAPYGLRHE